jgi:acyl carrier protein
LKNPGLGSADNSGVVQIIIIRKITMALDKVAEIIAKTAHCKVEDITPETELQALGIDSLKAITVLFELEEAFDIEIPNELISSIITVDDILDTLETASC